jgi:hypothetical protein
VKNLLPQKNINDIYENEEGINDNGGWGGYDMATYRTGWDIASRHGNH